MVETKISFMIFWISTHHPTNKNPRWLPTVYRAITHGALLWECFFIQQGNLISTYSAVQWTTLVIYFITRNQILAQSKAWLFFRTSLVKGHKVDLMIKKLKIKSGGSILIKQELRLQTAIFENVNTSIFWLPFYFFENRFYNKPLWKQFKKFRLQIIFCIITNY